MAETLLSLSTQTERKVIKIDGVAYPLRSLSEFSLKERHDMARSAKGMAGLNQVGSDEDAASAAVDKAVVSLNETFLRIVIGGDRIADKLTDEHKLAVLNCFFEQAGVMPKTEMKSLRRSRASKDSTAETLKTG